MLTQLPGFADPVHDSQQTFRALLDALAQPGLCQTTVAVAPPAGLTPSCAAAALTLLDLETTVWLQPGLPQAVSDWLLFHTGCQFTEAPQAADFALIEQMATAPPLTAFGWGSPEYPEASTSLLVQLPALQGGRPVTLQGPGILAERAIALPVPHDFWSQWQAMTSRYPLGVDSWWLSGDQVLGLPRTTRLQTLEVEKEMSA
ncbi:MAG: phosphonate C-P lyase system protein PhnH [Cyanobacteria bacterium J06626_4]